MFPHVATAAALLAACVSFGYAIPTDSHYERRADPQYDYVIVGGGTAGLTLANRLSANGSLQIAVIEAGSYYEVTNIELSSTPAGDVFWAGSSPKDTNPLVDWDFVTQPQDGANGRSLHYPRGKCLGGSSARNFMIYQRGTVGSYKKWADQVGDDSYTFDSLLPYFKRSVDFTPPGELRAKNASADFKADAFEQSGGPLQVSYTNYASPFSSYIEGSLNEIGLPSAEDFNSGSLMGSQYCSSTIDPSDEMRDSSQTSFLNEAKQRKNLKVYDNTLAKQIIFSNNTATGVRVTTGGVSKIIIAKREVILSAGAFQSPQLLMVSGVGPAETLKEFDIQPVSELSGVGQNMWDHIFFGPSYRVNVQTFTRLANDLVYVAAQFAVDYTLDKKGPLTNPVCDYLGWEKVPDELRGNFSQSATSDLAQYPEDWPEVEYLSAPGFIGNFSSLFVDQPKDGFQYATIMAALVAPMSRGNVTIKSKDTSDLPLINPNWLTSPTDQAVAIAAYKRLRQAFASDAMKPVLADPVEYFPGPKVQSDEQILEVIQNTLHTVYHASGTCKMGKQDDESAVVDTEGRVFGTERLRVVDTSSFPFLPPGHPQSTVYALAEKIAEGILKGN